MGKESRSPLKAVESKSVALPTQLEPSDLEYQTFLLLKIRAEQQAHQAEIKTWGEYLARRYSLGATDRVDEAGHITRVEPKESA
jgi:hypothetical protein